MDELNKIPPITRFLCGATLAVTLPVNLQLVSPYSIVFVKEYVIQNLEVSPRAIHILLEKPDRLPADMETVHLNVLCRYACFCSKSWAHAQPRTVQDPECLFYLSLSCSSEPNAT